MRHYLLIIAVILFSCNSNQQKKTRTEKLEQRDQCFAYPSDVDSLHIQDLYDSARWYIYARYCDVLYDPKSDSLFSQPFGELELKFDNLIIRNDTAVLLFHFEYMGEVILPSMMRGNKKLATGMGFDVNTKKRLYVISSHVTITYKGNPTSRDENPLQPEVIKYIKGNWEKLNDCFRKLAERKGINK